jgi:hypothetical protein
VEKAQKLFDGAAGAEISSSVTTVKALRLERTRCCLSLSPQAQSKTAFKLVPGFARKRPNSGCRARRRFSSRRLKEFVKPSWQLFS